MIPAIDSLAEEKVDSISVDSTAEEKIDTITKRSLSTINLGLLGDFSLVSLNLEKLFIFEKTFFISGKIGVGLNKEFRIVLFGRNEEPTNSYTIYPHHVTACYGNGRVYVEVGIGGAYISGSAVKAYVVYPIIGFRFIRLKPKSSYFRVFFMVAYGGWEKGHTLASPIGISFGGCF